jgi:2-oxoglutarate dehydrogenase E1 component
LLKLEIQKYPNCKELIWCQEEPINQGAWYTSRHNLMQCTEENQTLDVVARDLYSAPAEGSIRLHNINQNLVIEQALDILPVKQRRSI